jgi:poly(A) polymerase
MASTLSPEENMKLLEKAGLKVILTGMAHGTITAIYKSIPYEITTLRKDVATDGRRATVEYTDDWAEDTLRRNFTMNALYLDLEGNIFDYFDGREDIKLKKIKFIGEAALRIEEDALRILRFFRFSSQISNGALDEEGLKVCIQKKSLLSNLSGERINQEMKKIILSPDVISVIMVMEKTKILQELIAKVPDLSGFYDYVNFEQARGEENLYSRLIYLMGGQQEDVTKLTRQWRMSGKEHKKLLSLIKAKDIIMTNYQEKTLRKFIYLQGQDAAAHYMKDKLIEGADLDIDKVLSFIKNWQVPAFPLGGADLMDQGYPAGKILGDTLKRLENIWIESDFQLSKDDLLLTL